MFTDDFDPAATLAEAACPRCHCVGLVEVDDEIREATPPADRHQPRYYVDPSIAARCPACGLVMEWPGCLSD